MGGNNRCSLPSRGFRIDEKDPPGGMIDSTSTTRPPPPIITDRLPLHSLVLLHHHSTAFLRNAQGRRYRRRRVGDVDEPQRRRRGRCSRVSVPRAVEDVLRVCLGFEGGQRGPVAISGGPGQGGARARGAVDRGGGRAGLARVPSVERSGVCQRGGCRGGGGAEC